MKITLIRPNMGIKKGEDYQDLGSMEPYALAVIAGAIPPDIEVKLYDERLDEIDYNEETDLVAITVETFTARRAYSIANSYRKRGIPVVMGGFHASLIPEEVKEYADSVVVGEAEPVFKNIIDDIKKKQLKPYYYSHFTSSLSDHKTNRKIFKGKKYLPITLTHFSRGCPYSCSYCPDASLYKGIIRYRPVEDVLDDIKKQQRKLIFFVDNNISYNKIEFTRLLKAITPLKINWVSQADINIGKDDKLLKLMYKSGCLGLVVGFESLSENNLKQMNKTINMHLLSKYDELIKRIHSNGLSMWAAFLLGYDYDTVETIKTTLDFALKHKFLFAAFNQLIPYYNTPIYDFLKREKRLIFDKWWIDPDYRFGQVTYLPHNMHPEELSKACQEARLTFNNNINITKRIIKNALVHYKDLSSILLFFKFMYSFKKEIKNKQNMILK